MRVRIAEWLLNGAGGMRPRSIANIVSDPALL